MICFKCKASISDQSRQYGLHKSCFLAWFKLPDIVEFSDLDPKKGASKSGGSNPEFKKKDTFFHGQYLKYSAKLGGIDYILKVQEDRYLELPASEYLCNQIAKTLSIKVPEFYMIDFNGRPTFVARNFMQDYVGTLHHIYKFLPAGEENHNCELLAKCILEQTGKLADVAIFAEICLYDALVANNDRHGRNLGIIETAKGKILAPMYDNPSYLGIVETALLGAHFNVSGAVWTASSAEPKLMDYITEFKRLGHGRAVEQFRHRALSKSEEIFSLVKDAFMSPSRRKALAKLLEERMKDLENV